MNEEHQNGWNEYSKLVLAELVRADARLTAIEVGISNVRIDIARLQVKSGMWGAIAGLIPSAIAVGYILLKAG